MTTTVSVRPYAAGDQAQVLDLLRTALGETDLLQRTPELFAWKHLDNPFGRSIMLVAEDDDGIVGFRAFMRWELLTRDGEVLKCVRPVDTATHPRARRQGIFRRLSQDAVDMARHEGVHLVFNTPNPRSGAGYLSMGWMEVGRIGVMVRPLLGGWRREGWVEAQGSSPWSGRSLPDRPPRGLRTRRTEEYATWRYGAHPTACYQPVEAGTAVAVVRDNRRRGRQELVVSDLYGEGELHRAVRAAVQGSSASYAVGWFSPGSPERSAARRAGMVPLPGVKALTLVARPLADVGEIDRLERWDLSIGDLELL